MWPSSAPALQQLGHLACSLRPGASLQRLAGVQGLHLLQQHDPASSSTVCSRQQLDAPASTSGRSPWTSSSSDGWHRTQQTQQLHQTRSFAAQATPPPDPSNDASSIGNEKVQKLAQELLNLTVLESSWLTEILRKKLNLQKPAYGAMPSIGFGAPMGGQPQMSAPAAAAPAAAAPPAPAEAKKEKADFDVKLESFSADGKIKVIKEIRAITNLGLKEAKELVEKAPVVIKASVAKADAENMKKLIEAAGGKVTLA